MELREFVKATLVQIIEGVQDARESVATMEAAVRDGAEIVPSYELQKVEFDVAGTVVEGAKTGAGAEASAGRLRMLFGAPKSKSPADQGHGGGLRSSGIRRVAGCHLWRPPGPALS
jgi:hypothetical protein